MRWWSPIARARDDPNAKFSRKRSFNKPERLSIHFAYFGGKMATMFALR